MTARTSRADINYYSCTPEGYTFFAGSEHAVVALSPLPDGGVWMPPDPQSYDAIFKASRMKGLHLTGMHVSQGRENSLDANSTCSDCSFEGEFGVGGGEGDQIITTKGGCQRIVYVGTLWSHGRNADVVCAAWSDQSKELTTDIDYSGLKRADGQPITFILSRCRRIKLPPGARVLWFKSAGYEIYFWLKRAAVALHLIG